MKKSNHHQTSLLQKTSLQGQLVCPNRQTAFPITWRRYCSAPWGNYRRPECKKISYAKANSDLAPVAILALQSIAG